MSDNVLARVGSDIEKGSGLSGADFGVLSRLEGLGRGSLRQQELADSMVWHKSRLSHQLTRMQQRGYLERSPAATGRSDGVDHTTGAGSSDEGVADSREVCPRKFAEPPQLKTRGSSHRDLQPSNRPRGRLVRQRL